MVSTPSLPLLTQTAESVNSRRARWRHGISTLALAALLVASGMAGRSVHAEEAAAIEVPAIEVPAVASLAGDGPALPIPATADAAPTASSNPDAISTPDLPALAGAGPALPDASAPETTTTVVETATPDVPALTALDGDGPALPLAAPVVAVAVPTLPALPALDGTGPAVDMPARVDTAAVARALELAFANPTGRLARIAQVDRDAIAATYSDRDWQPVFSDANGLTPKATALVERLGRAAFDGLDPASYAVGTQPTSVDPIELATHEIDLVATALRFARDASQGRIDPRRISSLITVDLHRMDAATILRTLATSPDMNAALDSFNPQHPGFQALRAKLAAVMAERAVLDNRQVEQPPPIPTGPALRVGVRDTRVTLVRNRLGLDASGGTTANDADLFDASLAAAVRTFQREHGLTVTGIVGPQTLERLNAGPLTPVEEADRTIADIIANLERWRWLPRDLGRRHVLVNVADFSLVIKRDGDVIHRARTIVGKVDVERQTPIFSDMMDHLVVNPSWNVPPSIVRKEMMGKLRSGGLSNGNWDVSLNGRRVDPATVDWSTVSPAAVHVRQKPGPSNALGNIKFMFPNNHAVYIHDTASRGLFAEDYRALSHGCVRVHEPFEFANALLEDEPNISGDSLKRMVGVGGERFIRLKTPIPVHISYFTSFIDDNGQLVTRPDIYGHHGRLKAALGL
jgi:murein L,D-transpeptidase YcbB/YkuD